MARKSATPNRKRPSTAAARQAAAVVRPSFWQQSEFWGLILILVGLVTGLSLALPDRGSLGAAWSLALRQIFGLGAYPVALAVLAGGVLLLARRNLRHFWVPRWQVVVGGEMAYFGGLGLLHILAGGSPMALYYEGRAGGIIGWAFWRVTVPYLGVALSALLLGGIALGGVYLAAGVHWRLLAWRIRWLWASVGLRLRGAVQAAVARRPAPAPILAPPPPARRPAAIHPAPFERAAQAPSPRTRPAPASPAPRPAATRRIPALATPAGLPPLDLLVPDVASSGDDADARQKAQIIEDTLEAFGIPAQVVEWHRGPVVTQFGVEPGFVERQDRDGNLHRFKVRVSKILALTMTWPWPWPPSRSARGAGARPLGGGH
jgi:S-DNA-T family DNA segregation ATPase FtsK/SpoIIIE